MKIRLTRAGGQFSGPVTVEIADGAAACRTDAGEFQLPVADDLRLQLAAAVRRVLEITDPVAERLGPTVDGTSTTINLEDAATRTTIELDSADEPSPELWNLLDLIDAAAPPDVVEGGGQERFA